MKSLTESPAILTVHAGPAGQYLLRITDLRHRPLVIGVTRLLHDATSFVVITPSDIRVFAVDSLGTTDASADSDVDADADIAVSPEMEAAIRAEESRSVPGDAIDATADDAEPTAPAAARVVKRKRPAPVAGHDEPCQRCAGTGRTRVILDGGMGADAACPICKGEGMIRRYGARR